MMLMLATQLLLDGAGTIEIASSVALTTGDTNDQELSGTISGSDL